ncbi:E3 ubiquitin-protein ligase TRIM56-like isoform X2 [Gigantopelta aegis]|uniref:E3 ubiquitin-protein ligase TRIM56-like isoform X2 n=1 Tax=Gigantopelta aegis TaxID=1735272 RepID=UPI001B88AF89|nr:E3 ubiquitin-protein ligase TRIM56-like isoform X2 [Gigantopelta aegis]
MMAESPYVPILEIRDEFVTCEICMEYFNDGEKCPRILPCHHSFCCQCLISLWENSPQGVTCPNCQHVWPVRNSIEATFQQNKVLSNLVEYIALKNRTGDTICHECPNDSKASFRCFDCQQYMCEGCTACHRKFTTTKTHKTVLITELINMSQDEYFQENEMCQNHENVKLEIFCKGCSTPVCPNCALVSHRDHDICNLKDIYNEKKTLIRAGLKCLQVSEETLKTVSESLAVGNQTVAVRERNMLIDIDEKSNKTIAKVMEITRRLKEDVISKAAKQKALRTEQIELIAQSQGVKAEHILHCQQALQFSCQVELINMSHVLENETKNLMKTPKLPKLKMGTINMDLTVFEQIDKTIQKTAILDDKPELSPCIEVMDATIEENSTVVTIVLLPKENMLKDNKIVVVSAIQCEDVHQNLEQRVKTFADIAESLQYRHDITAPDKTSMSINGRQLSGDRFVLHKREQVAYAGGRCWCEHHLPRHSKNHGNHTCNACYCTAAVPVFKTVHSLSFDSLLAGIQNKGIKENISATG